jgi:hypothetical protein
MKEWRPCKFMNPKYLEHVTCSWMSVDPNHSAAHCKDCICSKAETRKLDNIIAVATVIAIIIGVITIVLEITIMVLMLLTRGHFIGNI